MSYSQVNLILALPRLIKRINKSEKPHFISKITSGISSRGNFQVYITLNHKNQLHYNFEIDDKGEIYNSLSNSGVTACVVDWLLHIDQKRQIERVEQFKMELIENVWNPLNFMTFVDPD
jgi:hypothetical protein